MKLTENGRKYTTVRRVTMRPRIFQTVRKLVFLIALLTAPFTAVYTVQVSCMSEMCEGARLCDLVIMVTKLSELQH